MCTCLVIDSPQAHQSTWESRTSWCWWPWCSPTWSTRWTRPLPTSSSNPCSFCLFVDDVMGLIGEVWRFRMNVNVWSDLGMYGKFFGGLNAWLVVSDSMILCPVVLAVGRCWILFPLVPPGCSLTCALPWMPLQVATPNMWRTGSWLCLSLLTRRWFHCGPIHLFILLFFSPCMLGCLQTPKYEYGKLVLPVTLEIIDGYEIT